jgi:hypothetical protein
MQARISISSFEYQKNPYDRTDHEILEISHLPSPIYEIKDVLTETNLQHSGKGY